jgi:Rab-GTPase-TBC domain
LSIIDKDLQRLPSPNINDGGDNCNSTTTTTMWNTPEQQTAWMEALRELLYIFAQENSHIGYRQGMHEVASYLWLVLVLDRQRLLAATTNDSDNNNDTILALAFDRPAAYTMLRSILGHIRQAFDVKVASNSRPLEDMSHSILFKLQQYYHHAQRPDRLSPLLRSLSVPPQLYCTKWIRLLFSREVVGANNVLAMWSVFIQLVSEGYEWMAILETTAASRILLCQEALLTQPSDGNNNNNTAAHHHNVMDLLMNMPPLVTIEPLVQQINELLELQQQQQQQQQTYQLHPELVTLGGAPDETMIMHPHRMPPQYRQHHHQQQQHQPDNHPLGFGKMGEHLFNLQAVRQSLGQGVERLSSSSDTWKKKLEEGWNGLKQQPFPRPLQLQQRQYDQQSFRMDPSMFGDLDGDRMADAAGVVAQPPAPIIHPAVSQYHGGMSFQQKQLQQQRLQHPPPAVAHSPVFGQGHGTMNGSDPMMTTINTPGQPPSHLPPPQPHGVVVGGEPLQSQNFQQLAYRLGNSAVVLQEFAMSIARTPDPQQYQHVLNSFQLNGVMSSAGTTKVPNAVWEALAEVEAVRTILLQRGPH